MVPSIEFRKEDEEEEVLNVVWPSIDVLSYARRVSSLDSGMFEGATRERAYSK